MKTAYTGKLIQHCYPHLKSQLGKIIIIINKLTNPQIKITTTQKHLFQCDCVENFESCKWCGPWSAQGSTGLGRWWRAQRSTVYFTWDDTCLQKHIISDDVRSSTMTDWLSDARWTAITKKQFFFINAACFMEKHLREKMKNAFISIFCVKQT